MFNIASKKELKWYQEQYTDCRDSFHQLIKMTSSILNSLSPNKVIDIKHLLEEARSWILPYDLHKLLNSKRKSWEKLAEINKHTEKLIKDNNAR